MYDTYDTIMSKEKEQMKLRQLLIQYEIEHDLSHDDMIQKLEIGRSTYFRWLSGESINLKISTLNKLSNLFGEDILELLDKEEKKKPIIGKVKAGYDLLVDQNIEGYIEVSNEDDQKGDYFLRVTGDSMEGMHIFEGDYVYVQQCSNIQSGQIGIILIGDEVTIKKVYYKHDLMVLESGNPKYETKFFTPKEIEELPVKVIGLARFIRRNIV